MPGAVLAALGAALVLPAPVAMTEAEASALLDAIADGSGAWLVVASGAEAVAGAELSAADVAGSPLIVVGVGSLDGWGVADGGALTWAEASDAIGALALAFAVMVCAPLDAAAATPPLVAASRSFKGWQLIKVVLSTTYRRRLVFIEMLRARSARTRLDPL